MLNCCHLSWGWGAAVLLVLGAAWVLKKWWDSEDVPLIEVDCSQVLQLKVTVENNYIYIPGKRQHLSDRVQCYDPATMQYLGFVPALKASDVQQHVAEAREAQREWAGSPFRQRRLFLRLLQRYIVANQDLICQVSARDSGKAMVDAGFGEIFTTCEKIAWLLQEGERWLRPEYRSAGRMMVHKAARVEFPPLGVLGAIVPWNYPFHNILNPVLSAVFSGNAIVVKVSEHTSWSARYYLAIIRAALKAAGAPPNLVHIITGYGKTGEALVRAGVDKLTFVGSTQVGKKVMAAASESLTPVVLELGGKDAFIICDDADMAQVVPIALRGSFQCSGQNCIGAERFYVQARAHNTFVGAVLDRVRTMRVGPPLGPGACDMGAICMPSHAARLQELVDDAVSQGAKVAAGGRVSPGGGEGEEEGGMDALGGQFYPPTVLLDVHHSMRIMREEVFGPIMAIMKFEEDREAVQLANDCAFGLGCSVFSASHSRASGIAAQIHTGMVSINDFASTYMCQSLPFGGVKESGFDRFGGVEGLRGCCNVRAVVEDRWWPLVKTYIPKPLQYPVAEGGFEFQQALVRMFYGTTLRARAGGLLDVVRYFTRTTDPRAAR